MTAPSWQHYASDIERHFAAARQAFTAGDLVLMRLHDKEVNRLWADYYRAGGSTFDEYKIWDRLGLLIAPMAEVV